jgi:hypothetical protein
MPWFLLRYRWTTGSSSGPREKVVQAVSAEDAASSFTNEEIKEGIDMSTRERSLRVRVHEISDEQETFMVKPSSVTVERVEE